MTDAHHAAMLARGWTLKRDLFGNVEWLDPTAAWHKLSDADAYLHWNAGDWRSAPRLRRPEKLEEMRP